MTEHNDSAIAAITKVIVAMLAWFGGIKLADVQILVAIFSGLAVGGYAALQFYVLWRDKVRKP